MLYRIFTALLIFTLGFSLPACQNRFTSSQGGVDANDIPPRDYHVGVAKESLHVRPGAAGSSYITVTNYGTKADTYTITAPTSRSTLGWVTFEQTLPLTITLEPDQHFGVPYMITVPVTATSEMIDHLEIKVENHAFIYVFDVGGIDVKVET